MKAHDNGLFSVFISGSHISKLFVFAREVFHGLCLWMRIFDI